MGVLEGDAQKSHTHTDTYTSPSTFPAPDDKGLWGHRSRMDRRVQLCARVGASPSDAAEGRLVGGGAQIREGAPQPLLGVGTWATGTNRQWESREGARRHFLA